MLVAGRLSLLKSVQFVVFHVRYGVCSEEFGLSDAAAGKKVDSAMLLLGTTRVDWEMVETGGRSPMSGSPLGRIVAYCIHVDLLSYWY